MASFGMSSVARATAITNFLFNAAGIVHVRDPVARRQAQAARLADTVALFQALGGGWWNRPETVAPQISAPQAWSPRLAVPQIFVPEPSARQDETLQ
jgi:hypothetical protein